MSLSSPPAQRDALARWLDHLRALDGAAANTLTAYARDVTGFLGFLADHHGGARITFNDPRRFGSVEYVSKAPGWEHAFVRFSKLGPEPFSDLFTPESFFKATRGKKVSIKALLLSGLAVVGVGNIYACEALFRSAIRPGKAAGRLSRAEVSALHAAVVAVLAEAIERGGSTLRNFQAIDGELGHFQLHCDVYGREGQLCKRCGATVKRRVMNQRSTFYCAGCQK